MSVAVKEHARFTRDGHDILSEEDVDYYDAILGNIYVLNLVCLSSLNNVIYSSFIYIYM